MGFDIYFRDLNKEAQSAFLEYFELRSPAEANYDVLPITTIEGHEPELTELKLYCPLVISMEPQMELGEDEEEPYEISGNAASIFEAYVSEAVHLSMTAESPRGLMDYHNGSPEVNDKVYSMYPAVEVRNGELTGVCILQLKAPLSSAELNEVREEAIGQFSDGWGEGFEQNAIQTPHGDMYISFWNSSRNNALKTEQEMTAPKKSRGDAR